MAINFLNTVAVDENVLFVDTVNDRVGIGTDSPSAKLHVEGDIELISGFSIGSNDGNYWQRIRTVDNTPTTTNAFNFETRNGSGNYLTHMVIRNDGNVGINTTSPLSKFQVNGQASVLGNSFNGLAYFNGTDALASYNTANKIVMSSNGSADGLYTGGLHLTRRALTQQGHFGSGIRGISVGTVLQDNALELYTSTNTQQNATRLKITSTGNVGIGTTAPTSLLHVKNSTYGSALASFDTNGRPLTIGAQSTHVYMGYGNREQLKIAGTSGNGRIIIGTSLTDDGTNTLQVGGTGYFSGNVGIGTTTPDAKLSVVGATSTNDLIGGSINLATSSGWVIPSGAMSTRVGYYGGNFTLNGDAAENGMEWGLGPFNDRQLLWTTTGSTDSNADGGWNKTLTNLDIESPYLSVVYFKRVSSSTSGTFYHGTGNDILNLDGTSNTNPYFLFRALSLFDQDVWYASVGVIQSNSDSNTTAYTDISGLYRLDTGVKVANANAFKFASTGATLSRGHRAYLYYSTDTSVVGHFANPGFYKIDGDQPKLHDIVSGDTDDVFWSANGNDIYNDNSGNVGIGTSSPGSKLDIISPSLASQFKLSNTTADTTTKYGAIVGRHYTNSEEPVTGMLITSSSSGTGGSVSIGGGISAANAVNNIILYTAANNTTLTGTERMRVASNGNVGIGTTSPAHKLTVNASNDTTAVGIDFPSAHFDFSANSTSGYTSNFRLNDVGMDIGHDSTSRSLNLQTGNLDRVTILGNGKVGIGATSPQEKLDVGGSIYLSNLLDNDIIWKNGTLGTGPSIGTNLSAALIFKNSSNNAVMTIVNSTGNVGIGTTSPGYKLDVSGTGRFTSTVTATNFILSSDKRKKTKIKDLTCDNIDVNWKSFELKESEGEYRTGVIAQELEQSHPEFVKTDEEGFKSVKYIDLLIAKIAELEARLEKLEK